MSGHAGTEGAAPVATTAVIQTSVTNGVSPVTKENSMAAALAEVSSIVTPDLLKLSMEMVTIVPKGIWEDLGSEEEIRRENAVAAQCRGSMQVHYSVPRNVLFQQGNRGGRPLPAGSGAHVLANCVTKEASEDCRDLRGTVNPLYDTVREEVEVGVQATPVRVTQPTQTHFARKVNAAVQAEPTLVDASIRHMTDLPKKESPNLSQFLSRVLPRTLHCLTQNFEVPIYTDDFALFREDDAIVGSRDDMVLLEKGTYAHTAIKERKITSLGWRGSRSKDNYVCIASIAPYSLEERIDAQRRCESSVSLVWDLTDPMHPRYILESPNEVQVLKFSPAHPNLIAGGAMNGQVYLWDLSLADKVSFADNKAKAAAAAERESSGATTAGEGGSTGGGADGEHVGGAEAGAIDFRQAGELPPMPDSVKGVSWEKDGDVPIPRLQPVQYSRVEMSHRRPVHDLQWLPDNLECTFDGKQVVVEQGSHQFATVSDDGNMCVWDIRPEHLSADRLRKMKHQTKSSGQDVLWVPFLKYQLTKPDATGGGDMMGFRFFFDGVMADETSPSYTVAVGGTDGELATCSAIAKNDGRRGSAVVPMLGTSRDTRFVRQVVEAHAGAVFCVQRHPSIGDVYLTCGDHTFKVWRAEVDTPLYRSPYIESAVTCAAWSPSRAAIVIIGTEDGKIQVWDLLDRNSEPLLVHHMVQDAITVLAFKPLPLRMPKKKKFTQHVVVGTTLGTFHWYLLPAALSRGSNGERRHFRAMLEREVRRVAYYDWRWHERRQEMERYGANAPKMVISAVNQQQQQLTDQDQLGEEGAAGGKPSTHPPLGAAKKRATGGGGGARRGGGATESFSEDDDDLFGGAEDGYGYDPQRDAEFLALVEELRVKEEEQMKVESIQ